MLQGMIKKAIEQKTFIFNIYGPKHIIEFIGKETIDFSNIEICGGYGKAGYSGEFNLKRWKKIIIFLKQLSEQPITIRFTELYSDGSVNKNPNIYLSGLSMNFNK